MGDFNMPNVQWLPNPMATCCLDNNFINVVESYCLEQLNHIPSTTHGNILDYVFTNVPEIISDVSRVDFDFMTDHAILNFKLCFKVASRKAKKRTIFNYKRANLNLMYTMFNNANLIDIVNNSCNIDEAWSNWCDTVLHVVDNCVPKSIISDNAPPPWFDKDVRHLINKKKTAWRQAKKKNGKRHWSKFKKLRNKLKRLLRVKYNSFIASLGDNCSQNPKKFWSFFKSKTKCGNIPVTVTDGKGKFTDPEDKASCFNAYFHSVFTTSSDASIPLTSVDSPVSEPIFTIRDIISTLKALDVNKSVGPDGISPFVLRHCCYQLAPSLCALFNLSMQTGVVPSRWKEANVTPVFKSGDKDNVSNY